MGFGVQPPGICVMFVLVQPVAQTSVKATAATAAIVVVFILFLV